MTKSFRKLSCYFFSFLIVMGTFCMAGGEEVAAFEHEHEGHVGSHHQEHESEETSVDCCMDDHGKSEAITNVSKVQAPDCVFGACFYYWQSYEGFSFNLVTSSPRANPPPNLRKREIAERDSRQLLV